MTIESITVTGTDVRVDVLYEGKLVLHTFRPGNDSSRILVSASTGTFRLPKELALANVHALVGPVTLRVAEIKPSGLRSEFKQFNLKSGAEKEFNSSPRQLELIIKGEFGQLMVSVEKLSGGSGAHSKDIGN